MNLIAKEKVLRYMDDLEYANQPMEEPTADYKELYQWVRRYIAALQPEESRPKGKWIDLDDKEEIYASMWKCSNCGAIEISNEPPNYCYNCGADMRGEE